MSLASTYAAQIRSTITALTLTGILSRQPSPITIKIDPGNRSGTVIALRLGLLYHDHAFLRIEEKFYVDEQELVYRSRYTYHYERPGGYYLRFEREQHDEDKLYKPEHHLHVCWRLPHFPAPPVTLLETLDLIRINFYSPYRQRLVSQSLAIQI